MIKCLAALVTMFIATAIYSQDQALLNYVPRDIDGFVCVNIQEALTHPKLKEFIDSPKETDKEFIEFKKTLSDNGIDIYKAVTNGVIYFRIKGQSGGVVKTSISESKLAGILEKSEKTKDMFKKSVVKGKTIYSISSRKPGADDAGGENDDSTPVPGGKDTFFAYAAPDIVVISDKKDEISKMTAMQDGAKVSGNLKLMNLSSNVDKAATVWGVCEYNPPDRKKTQEGDDMSRQMLPVDNICGGSLAVKLTGDKKDVISSNLRLNCLEKAKAQMLTIQLQAIVMMAIPNMSQGNAQLGEELTKAIKFANEENDIVVNLEITPSIIEQIQKASQNAGGRMQPGAEPEENGVEGAAAAPDAAKPAKPAEKAKPEAAPKAN